MREMKDSGIEWIGKVPNHWREFRLKNLAQFQTGSTPPNKIGISTENGIPWYTPNEIQEFSLALLESKQLLDTNIISNFSINLFPKNSILFVGIASIGKIGILKEKAYSNQQITCIIPNFEVSFIFLAYFLLSMKDFIVGNQNSNVVPIINNRDLGSFRLVIPKKKEQQKIANFLDQKCTDIDGLIEDINKQIEILNEYKQSIITETVTKGLNPSLEMKDSGIEWIRDIPKDWKTTKIKAECTLKGRIGWQGLTEAEYIEEGPFLVTGIDFNRNVINWDSCHRVSEWRFDQDKNIQIKENDLLITKDGTVGKVALAKNAPEKVTLNSGVMLIRPKKEIYLNEYLFYIMNSDIFWQWFYWLNSGNTTIQHLYQHSFKEFIFPLPDLKEQKEIVQYLDSVCSELDLALDDMLEEIKLLEEYKKSLIFEYVTGKKEVPVE